MPRRVVHRAAATRSSCSRPVRAETFALSTRCGVSEVSRVSSTKPGRLPVPTCTKTRTPAACRRSISGPNRTGSDEVAQQQVAYLRGVVRVAARRWWPTTAAPVAARSVKVCTNSRVGPRNGSR